MKKRILSLALVLTVTISLSVIYSPCVNAQGMVLSEIENKVSQYAMSLHPLTQDIIDYFVYDMQFLTIPELTNQYGKVRNLVFETKDKYVFDVYMGDASIYYSYNKKNEEIKELFESQQGYMHSIYNYDKFDDWNEAYRTFLMYDWYRDYYDVSYKCYDSYQDAIVDCNTYYGDGDYPISALLYDMNKDGIPELIVYNGSAITVNSHNYVYTFSDGLMKCCGKASVLNGGGGITHFSDNSVYSGLYDSNGRSGYWNGSYFYLENDMIKDENIWWTPDFMYLPDNMEKRTNDNSLFELFLNDYNNDSFVGIPMTEIDEIKSMGWDAFLAQYGYGSSSVTLNGNPLSFSQPPVMENDRILVPMRAIFESLGAEVSWEDATRTAIGKKGGTEIRITIDDNVLYKNGNAIPLDVPARLINGNTMVPVRAIAEAFDCYVDWDDETQTVVISADDPVHA